MGGASIKINDDGSFNLLIGATDLGTGADTVLGQIAAEVLGVPLEDIIVYSSDTDFTPFDKGAYASSTTYISGTAVEKAAKQVADRIKIRAAGMFNSAEKKRYTQRKLSSLIELRMPLMDEASHWPKLPVRRCTILNKNK
jgi:putative selenate reductase molybdopterin-binding subunit